VVPYFPEFARAVWRSWVTLLSGSFGIFLLFVGVYTTLSPWIVYTTAGVCLAIAFYSVWLNEFRSRRAAETALRDSEARKQKLLQLAALVRQGRQLQLAADRMHSGNAREAYQMKDEWHFRVRQFVAAHNPYDQQLPNLSSFASNEWDKSIEADIDSLERLRDGF
jgi:hypothetical protein